MINPAEPDSEPTAQQRDYRFAGMRDIRERESSLLASYAMHSADSMGRKHEEPAHPYRGPFQRDRDRILHSAAFRRLSGKMQVFTGDMGDYHRTRMTHTMEVASVARTMGRALCLNEDLIEALALLHDIGHPPFGHAGEDALNECLSEIGGFSHNRFALVLVEELEQRYETFPGLNLSSEVLAGQQARCEKGNPGQVATLEAQLVDVADSITYDAHDVDDALKLGLVTLEELREVPLVDEALNVATERGPKLDKQRLRRALVHELIDRQVTDVLHRAGEELSRHSGLSGLELSQIGFRFSACESLAQKKASLEQFLHQQVYRHETLIPIRQQAQQRISELFECLTRNTELLPKEMLRRSEDVGLYRAASDYLAGMTDRYCVQFYQKHIRK